MVAPAPYCCSLTSFASVSSSFLSRPLKIGTRRSDSVGSVLTAMRSSSVNQPSLRYASLPGFRSDPPAPGSLSAQVGRLEAIAQLPDAVDIAPAAGVDAVFAHAGEALVIGRQRQLRIAELGEIGTQQRRAQLGVIHRVVQVDPAVQQPGPGPR